MHYLFTPFERHFDRGFGAVANSFFAAAEELRKDAEEGATFLNRHLPVSFLYRHAIELFLKSGIIILHRRLRVPYGNTADKALEPQVRNKDVWRPMHTVHDVAPLYAYLKELFETYREVLNDISAVSWKFPDGADAWFAEIAATDSSSTFFRYPVTKHSELDKLKSTSKELPYKEIFGRMGPGFPNQRAFIVLNDDEEVVEAFHQDDDHVKSTMATLRQASEMLYGCHAAMRGELTDGW